MSWPPHWWRQQADPPAETRSLQKLIAELAPTSASHPDRWTAVFEAPPEAVRDLWCDHLAAAVGQARAGSPIPAAVDELTLPFLVHAEYRRRLEIGRAQAEAYIAELSDHLARALA